tara:strand:+ start:2081 stop:2299 length:219 start_codon:yes stop_codon:yes gene_type:complete
MDNDNNNDIIKEEFITEMNKITKEDINIINEKLTNLIKYGRLKDTENEKESDMYVDLYNTICEKYNPVGEHN